MARVEFETSRRSSATARAPSTASTSRSPTASSWCWSGRPAAARPPRSGWSPGSRRSPTAPSGSATGSSTTSRRRAATSRWSSRATPSTRISRSTTTSRSPLKLKKMPKDGDPARACDEAARILDLEPLLGAQAARAFGRPAAAGCDGAGDRARSRRCSSWTSRSRTSTRSSGCRCARTSRGSRPTSA